MTSPGYPTLHDSSDQRQPPILPGEELAGKYRIETVVGAGAMGVVVRAWHIELEQPVAVKFLYPEYARNADGAERFRREARAAAKIKNQHVTRVIDVGTLTLGGIGNSTDGRGIPYIVMEYLEGHDLSHELREHGPLPVPMAVRYVMQACEAVAEAHERGIVHRDLKPANLFLAEGNHGERMIKVLDFGISKVSGAQQFSLTDTATLMGSPAYMSPEQLESSRNVDGRADIWSLGVILHELILGQVPFNGDSVPQLVRSILLGTRTTLVERDPGLEELESVVARCLCQDREQRFENVSALSEALRPFAESPGTGSNPSLAVARVESTPPPATSGGVATAGSEQQGDGKETSEAPGVPSAWGNTQRGRHRSWQRHLPLALLLAVVGSGAYGISHLVTPRPPPNVTERQLANSPAPARAELSRAEAETAPEGTSRAAAQPVAGSDLVAPPQEGAPNPPALDGAGGAADVPGPATPRVSVVGAEGPAAPSPGGNTGSGGSSATAAAAPVPKLVRPAASPGVPPAPGAAEARKAVPNAAAKPSGSPAGSSPAASSPATSVPAATPPRATAPDPGDKPKSEPSPRSGSVDVPDFGGRE